MTFNFKERIEFEMNKKRIMSFFPEGKKIGLTFTQIKNMIGLTSPRTSRLLKSLIEDGFLQKKNRLYFNGLATYRGEFDIWDLMNRIDKISQNNGKIIKEDMGGFSGLCSILTYGCIPYEKMTPLEREMVFQLMNKFRNTFLELSQLIDSIKYRKFVEKRMKLPETCKNIIFGKESGEIDFSAVDKIYGDALWNYIFNHYVGIFHFQLTKGYMDIHGLKDLFHILEKTVDAIDVEVKNKGPFEAHYFPKTKTSNEIPLLPRSFFSIKSDNVKENAIGVMITPSPRCLAEYSDKVGRIIEEQINAWKYFECIGEEKTREDINWNDIIQELPEKRKRREWLRITLIESLMLRYKNLSEIDRKLMMNDSMLNGIFNKTEIKKILSKLDSLRSRLLYFNKRIRQRKSIIDLKKDPKWFKEEEIRNYKPITDFVFDLDFFQYNRNKKNKIKDVEKIMENIKDIDPKVSIDMIDMLEERKNDEIKKYKKTKKDAY